jgi:hypothetical protein
MLAKISTGKIYSDEKGNSINFIELAGEVLKIRIYSQKSNDVNAHLVVTTSDGEVIVDKVIGNRDWVLKPKDLDLEGGEVIGGVTKPSNMYGGFWSHFTNFGLMKIEVTNTGLKQENTERGLENIVITYR